MILKNFVYRHRYTAKRVLTLASRHLPERLQQQLRNFAERVAFSVVPQHQEETLPPIFSSWGALRLASDAARLGIRSPEELYFECITAACARVDGTAHVLSAGSGAGHLEIALAKRLRASERRVVITCLELNPTLISAGNQAAWDAGVADSVCFRQQDCNCPFVLPSQSVIIVNQFFHHVVELETFCSSLRKSLAADGVIATSDVVGRNGHRPWPAAQKVIDDFWTQLQPRHRLDRHTGRIEERFIPVDHSAYSNEGIRAQDVVGCLSREFDFQVFFTFGGAIMPFVERRLGFNFDPSCPSDMSLIRAFAARDVEELESGSYPASNMIAVLSHRGMVVAPLSFPTTPAEHTEGVRKQTSLCTEC